jgi:prolipoprotein diacylglyceryltransferase
MPFVIDVDAVAFQLGPLEIRRYGLAVAAVGWFIELARPRCSILRPMVPR